MSAASRRKGARYELDIANHLTRRGILTTRNLEQSRDGGADLLLPADIAEWLAIECKNVASASLGAWTDQARAAAGPNRIGAVIHHRRGNGNPGDDYATIRVDDLAAIIAALRGLALELGDLHAPATHISAQLLEVTQ